MPSCVVKWCKNNTCAQKKPCGITFHTFPTETVWKEGWIKAIRDSRNEEDWLPSKYSVVCSIHFEECDIYYTKCGFRRIKKNAKPKKVVNLIVNEPDFDPAHSASDFITEPLPQQSDTDRDFDESNLHDHTSAEHIEDVSRPQLENDMENYMRHKRMRSAKTVRIKPHHAPSSFDCWIQNGQSTSKSQLAEKQNMVDITASSCIEDSHADVNNFQAKDRNDPSIEITQAQVHTAAKERNEDAHYKCVCCLMVLVKEKVRTLWQEQIVNGEIKIYGNMLVDCFAFIWNKPEASLAARDFICTCCIQRLEEAVNFKHQVMVSQQVINNMTFISESHVMIQTENQDTNVETDLRYDFINIDVTDSNFNDDCIKEEATDPDNFNDDCIEEEAINPDDFNDDCIKEEATDPDDFNDDCIEEEAPDPDDFNDDCIKEEATDLNDFNDDCESSDVSYSENIYKNMCEGKVKLEIDDNCDNSDSKSDGSFCEDIDEVHKDEDNPHSSNVGKQAKRSEHEEEQKYVVTQTGGYTFYTCKTCQKSFKNKVCFRQHKTRKRSKKN